MHRLPVLALTVLAAAAWPGGAVGATGPTSANDPDLYRPAPRPSQPSVQQQNFTKRSPALKKVSAAATSRGVFLTPSAAPAAAASSTISGKRRPGQRAASAQNTPAAQAPTVRPQTATPVTATTAPALTTPLATSRATGTSGGWGALLAFGLPALAFVAAAGIRSAGRARHRVA